MTRNKIFYKLFHLCDFCQERTNSGGKEKLNTDVSITYFYRKLLFDNKISKVEKRSSLYE